MSKKQACSRYLGRFSVLMMEVICSSAMSLHIEITRYYEYIPEDGNIQALLKLYAAFISTWR
jgi:hypothetical protein